MNPNTRTFPEPYKLHFDFDARVKIEAGRVLAALKSDGSGVSGSEEMLAVNIAQNLLSWIVYNRIIYSVLLAHCFMRRATLKMHACTHA